MRATPDAPAQLMQLRQPKCSAFSISITVAFGTSTPTSISDVASKTFTRCARKSAITDSFSAPCMRPCSKPTRNGASLACNVVEFFGHGLQSVRVLLHAWINDISLPARRVFAMEELPDLRQLVGRANKSFDPAPARRQFVNDGQIQIAVEREPERAREWAWRS